MTVSIIAERGTHLLIANGDRYAVIERREDRFYNCHDDKRVSIPAHDLAAVGQILNDRDWSDRKTAETEFQDVVARGTDLAQRML